MATGRRVSDLQSLDVSYCRSCVRGDGISGLHAETPWAWEAARLTAQSIIAAISLSCLPWTLACRKTPAMMSGEDKGKILSLRLKLSDDKERVAASTRT